MKIRKNVGWSGLIFPALLLSGVIAQAQDPDDIVYNTTKTPGSACSLAASAGTYALIFGGFVQTTANGPFVPTRTIGTVTLDAAGNVSGSGTAALAGKILTDVFTGTATLNADCTGTVTVGQVLGGQTGPTLDLAIVAEPGGAGDVLVNSPQTELTGHLKKFKSGSCSLTTAAGTYGLLLGGFVQNAANGPFVPARVIGTATVDALGNVTGSGTVTLNGAVLTDSFTGTATLNADCTGTLSVTQSLGGQTQPTLALTVVAETTGWVEAMASSAQTALSGHMKKIK